MKLQVNAYFGASRSLISGQAGHSFRGKPVTHFGASRSLISGQAGHPFRGKPVTELIVCGLGAK